MLTALLMVLAQSYSTGTGETSTHTERMWREGMRAWGRNAPRGGPAYAFFEFAPASGAGMGTACACTTPTGAKGEVLTFTRGSSATCMKGNVSASIANGDLVVCSTNQPRVMPGGDGTGALGLLVESARTNSALRSSELDNAVWLKLVTAGAVTVTADQAVAPDGTTTAERLQFTACPTDPTTSGIYQIFSLAAAHSSSVYVKGNGTSGNIGLVSGSSNALPYKGATCAYNSTTWTRCIVSNTGGAAPDEFYIGCINNSGVISPNPGNTGAGDVFVWGAQVEAGAYATSYIPTTSAAATRSLETAAFNGSTLPGSPYSKAATIIVPWTTANEPALPSILMGEKAPFTGSDLFFAGGGLRVQNGTGAAFVSFTTASITVTANTPLRLAASSGGGFGNVYVNGALFSGPTALTDGLGPNANATGLADNTVGVNHLDGVVKQVCWDGSLARCR